MTGFVSRRQGRRVNEHTAGSNIEIEREGSVHQPDGGVPRALERRDEIRRRMRGRQPVIFLDYDGTLSPIVERPQDAVLSERMRERVRKLADLYPVAVVSGRDLPDVRRRVGLDDVLYAGSHGFDIEGPAGMRMEHEEAAQRIPLLDRIEEELREALAEVEGAEVERKKFSLAIHYRRVAEAEVSAVEKAVDSAMERFPKLRRTSGKKVFDIQPKLEWDKGRALVWLMEALERSGRLGGRKAREAMEAGGEPPLAIFVGDDVTDEDAFRVLRERDDGIGIAVQERDAPTAAHYSVPDTEGVAELLDLLAEPRDAG
jgi:trehalose-phosphatase